MPRKPKKHRLSKLRDKITNKRIDRLKKKVEGSKRKRKDLVHETVTTPISSTYQLKGELTKKESKKHQRLFEKEQKKKRKIAKLSNRLIERREDRRGKNINKFRKDVKKGKIELKEGGRIRDMFTQQYD